MQSEKVHLTNDLRSALRDVRQGERERGGNVQGCDEARAALKARSGKWRISSDTLLCSVNISRISKINYEPTDQTILFTPSADGQSEGRGRRGPRWQRGSHKTRRKTETEAEGEGEIELLQVNQLINQSNNQTVMADLPAREKKNEEGILSIGNRPGSRSAVVRGSGRSPPSSPCDVKSPECISTF